MTLTVALTLLLIMSGINYGGETVLSYMGFNMTSNNGTSTTVGMNDGFNVKSNSLVIALFLLFSIGAIAGSIFSKESTLLSPIAAGLLGVGIGNFISILLYVDKLNDAFSNVVFNITLIIFSIYIIGYIISMVEWWRGSG